jgi:hypothetical protein
MSDLNVDELIKLAEKAEEKKKSSRSRGEHKEHSSVSRFIREFGVRPGTDLVPNYVIFYTYRVKWKGLPPEKKTNKINFFRAFNKQFTQKRTGRQRYYLLDGSTFDTSREGIEEAKFYEQKTRKAKETIKKKQKSLAESGQKPEHQS